MARRVIGAPSSKVHEKRPFGLSLSKPAQYAGPFDKLWASGGSD